MSFQRVSMRSYEENNLNSGEDAEDEVREGSSLPPDLPEDDP